MVISMKLRIRAKECNFNENSEGGTDIEFV